MPYPPVSELKIQFSATNPCHMYEMAVELYRREVLAAYHSGYPGWKLKPPAGFPLREHVWRTLVTYGLNRLPGAMRPEMTRVFRWQDDGFDRVVAESLEPSAAVHALPGQARATLRRAKELGAVPVLNHATGPLRSQGEVLVAAGQKLGDGFEELVARHEEEYNLAEKHVVGSSVVRDQLVALGIEIGRVRVIPYSADRAVFFPGPPRERKDVFRFLFAGQLTARKGLGTLRSALEALPSTGWELVMCGPTDGRFGLEWLAAVGKFPVQWRGSLGRRELAEEMRGADVLVLPSLEEGFGLVVPQALACGCPCVVSDRVGAKDLLRHRENGSRFPVGSAEFLAMEMRWWMDHRADVGPVRLEWTWADAAEALIRWSGEGGS